MENETPKGITVTYDPMQVKVRHGRRELIGLISGLAAVFVVACVGLFLYSTGHHGAGLISWLAAAGMGLVGANTVTFDASNTIPSGTTPPTAAQAFGSNQMSAVITGDNAATSFTMTHNWGISAAGLTAALPWVVFEPLLAAFYGANPLVTTRNTNNIVFTVVAFTGAAFRVRLMRPYSPDL